MASVAADLCVVPWCTATTSGCSSGGRVCKYDVWMCVNVRKIDVETSACLNGWMMHVV